MFKTLYFIAALGFLSAGLLAGTEAYSQNRKAKSQRTVPHTSAYHEKASTAPHISIKVTPPPQSGREGFIAVEIYNYTSVDINGISFFLVLHNRPGVIIESEVKATEFPSGWGGISWVKIPDAATFPTITGVEVKNLRAFGKDAKEFRNPRYVTDLIRN